MKQQQKIVKKGQYYQIQTYEETMMLMSKSKRQQTVMVSSTNIPVSEYIANDLPSFRQARNNYYCDNLKQEYSQKNVVDLKVQLQLMASQQNLNDEDSKQIQRLMEEIDLWRDDKVVELNFLPQNTGEEKQQAKDPNTPTRVILTAKYNISRLTEQIHHLQKLDFPQLHNLQHQLQIMLGQKKPIPTMQPLGLYQQQKQPLNNLYNHLMSLSILNNTSGTIQSIMLNEEKHVEMQAWVLKNEEVHQIHNDFLKELRTDQELVEKLQRNFRDNAKQVREILNGLKQ